MKILCVFHGYPPYQQSGAEWMLYEVNEYLASKGIQVNVWCTKAPNTERKKKVADNHYVIGGLHPPQDISQYDLIVTHLNHTGLASNLARSYNKPLVFFSHSEQRYSAVQVRKNNVYVVYNAFHTVNKTPFYHQHPSIIVRPPVGKERYLVKGRRKPTKVTMVNLNENKGGYLFRELAKQMPSHEFLGVKGAYLPQIVGDSNNMEIWDVQDDMTKVYRNTDILLVMSKKESYGRVAVEAMLNGIPVIASATDGLKEACGEGAYYIKDINDYDAWKKAIADVQANRDEWSEKGKLRYEQIQQETASELTKLEGFLADIIDNKFKHR